MSPDYHLCIIEGDSGFHCNYLREVYYACIGDFDQFLIQEGDSGHIILFDPNWIGFIKSNLGDRNDDNTKEFLDKSKEVWEGIIRNKRGYKQLADYELAAFYAFMGDKEETYRILHEMQDNDSFYGLHIKFMPVDPRFKEFWEEDEFKQIVQIEEKRMLDIRIKLNS